MRTLELELGHLYLAPGPRDYYHRTHQCPDVVPGYTLLEPGDDGYSHIITVLDECEWCEKFRHELVSPVRRSG